MDVSVDWWFLEGSGGEEFVSLKWPSTLLLRCASEVVEEWSRAGPEGRPALCDIVGCHATNFGTQADYEELRISVDALAICSLSVSR